MAADAEPRGSHTGAQPDLNALLAALHLEPELTRDPRDAYLVEREFAHLHGVAQR